MLAVESSAGAGLWRALALADYNSRVVFAGTVLLGAAAGLVGAFMLFRKRSLAGDVISHATLPGVAFGWLLLELMSPGSGKQTWALLLCGGVSGLCGVAGLHLLQYTRRLREDAGLGIVLSLFFGLGVVLLTVVSRIPTGSSAGLESFVYGKAASITLGDVWLISGVSLIVLLGCLLLWKEFTLLCFDPDFAQVQGWPVGWLDGLLLLLVTLITVVGIQSAGVLLVTALLITPAAAARFWTDRLAGQVWLSAAFGGLSAGVGVLISASGPRLAAGAVIVLTGVGVFLFSLLCGSRRGLLIRRPPLELPVAVDSGLDGSFPFVGLESSSSTCEGGG